MKYDKPTEEEWVQPYARGCKVGCCDCGLVHTVYFRIYQGRVQFRVARNARSAGQVRRWMRCRQSTGEA